MKGYVYVLSNPSMPNLYKIGMTARSVEERIKELNTTGVPTPYRIEIKIKTNNAKQLEKVLHRDFNDFRINNKREFFNIPLSQIKDSVSARCTNLGINSNGALEFVEKRKSEKLGFASPYPTQTMFTRKAFMLSLVVIVIGMMYLIYAVNDEAKSTNSASLETYITLVTSLRIREQPSLKSAVVGELKKDECVRVILKENGWYMIREGWISAEYVKKTKCES